MIKMNELRQGNLVQTCKGEVIVWDWLLLTEGVNTWLKVGGSEVTADPIPINNEWLDRIGLKGGTAIWESRNSTFKLKMYKNNIRDGSGRYNGVTFSQMIGDITEHHIYNVCCRYLHELQNFYYMYTGQELTIKQ